VADPEPLFIMWTDSLETLFVPLPRPGDVFIMELAPADVIPGAIWGTGIYTSDSSIGWAAVHQGLLEPEDGGVVALRVMPGQAGYEGSQANGVSTAAYGSWRVSFELFNPGLAGMGDGKGPDDGYSPISWEDTADSLGISTDLDGVYRFLVPPLPPGMEQLPIWGSGPYTSDSSIPWGGSACRPCDNLGRGRNRYCDSPGSGVFPWKYP